MKTFLRSLVLALACPAAALAQGPLPTHAADVIRAGHLYLQAGKTALLGHAKTEAQAAQAAAYWADALKPAGVELGKLEYQGGMFTILYKTADGRAIRGFLAEPMQFPPKDEAGLRANMTATKAALAKAGLTPLAERVIDLDGALPTYCIFYLAEPDAVPEHEVNLRVLKSGDDVDFGVFAAAGVEIVQTPRPWMMVYIGPEVGRVGMAARTRERAEEKLRERRKFLVDAGKRIIAEKITPLDEGDFKFFIELYFFQ